MGFIASGFRAHSSRPRLGNARTKLTDLHWKNNHPPEKIWKLWHKKDLVLDTYGYGALFFANSKWNFCLLQIEIPILFQVSSSLQMFAL